MLKNVAKILENKKISRFKELFKSYVDSDLYILTVMAAAVLNWKFHVMIIIFAVGLPLALLIFIFDINRIRFIPLILGVIISLQLEYIPGYVLPATISSVIVFPILVYDLYRKKVVYNNKIFVGMVFLLLAMIFSVVNAPNFTTPFLGILMMFFYTFLFLYFYNKGIENSLLEENRQYLARSFNYMVLAILCEVLLFMFEINAFSDLGKFFMDKHIMLGWAMTNYIAMILLMIIPLSYYLYSKNQEKFYLLIFVLIELILLLLMLSRGAYLAILIVIVPFIVKFGHDVKDKVLFTKISLLAVIIILVITLSVFIPQGIVKSYFAALDHRGLSLSGRQILYQVGIQVFKRYPLFGGGVYTSEYYISLVAGSVYYHNYLIQTLATIGLVGLVAFLYYLYQILRASTKKGDYNTYVLFIVLNMMLHGLFDTTFYNPLVMVLFSLILPLLSNNNHHIAVNA